MRISELSTRSGVSVASIKFYLREGLLPPGTATASNQADYGEAHLHRLRLMRALRDIGGLDLARIKRVTTAIDAAGLPPHEIFGVVQRALDDDRRPAIEDDARAAAADVDRLLDGLGWEVSADAPARRSLAAALTALRRLGRPVDASVFRRYAEAIAPLAAWEVSVTSPDGDPSEAVERMAVGTVVFERAIVALRRLAHEHFSAARSRVGPGAD